MANKYVLILSSLLLILLSSCNQNTYSQGERLYQAHCANCHMDDGKGLAKLIPPLANSDYLKLNQEQVACIIRHGQNGKIVVNGIEYDQEMPGKKYTNIQVNNMINYINTAWGNDIPVVSLPQTDSNLKSCNSK